MNGYKTCPECGTDHRNAIPKCGCGYVWGKLKKVESKDPLHLYCAYESGSNRCRYLGTLSDSTNGGGPYYCSAHYHLTDPHLGAAITHKSHEDYPRADFSVESIPMGLVARVHALAAKRTGIAPVRYQSPNPGKAWAYRLKQREESGEDLPVIAKAMWREVVDGGK
jgi:hypothetical protein